MSRNIHFTTQSLRDAPSRAGANGDPPPVDPVVVDEHTYWTGKDYCFPIHNRDRNFPRFYHVVVSNLRFYDEYFIFVEKTQMDKEDEHKVFPIEPNEVYTVCIVLGGDEKQQPSAPRPFEVHVEEYATEDRSDKPKMHLETPLLWIPRPTPETVRLEIEASKRERRVRPWPRKQEVPFEASLINWSCLSITGKLSAEPQGENKEAGLEAVVDKPLSETILPNKQLPIPFHITLDKKLTAPVQVSVSAKFRVPALDGPENKLASPVLLGVSNDVDGSDPRVTPAQTVEIIPVPWLSIWQDWLVVIFTGFVLGWALFGMPPWVHPTTRLELKLHDLPADARPEDLKVTLTPASRDGRPLNMEYRTGRPVPGAKNGVYLYDFDWSWSLKGFRWAWPVYDLRLKVEPIGARANLYEAYDLTTTIPLKSDDKEEATISRQYGVSAETLQAELLHKNGINLLVALDPADQSKGDVTLTIWVNGQAMPNTLYVPGDTINVPENMTSGHKMIEIKIRATAQEGTLASETKNYPVRQSKPIAVKLLLLQRVVTRLPNTGGSPNIGGTPGTGGTPNTGGTPITGGAPTTGGHPGTSGAAGTSGKPPTTGTSSTGGTPATGGPSGANPPQVDPVIQQCCTYLDLTGTTSKAFSGKQKAKGDLEIIDPVLNPPNSKNEFKLSFKTNEECVYQIYDVSNKDGIYLPTALLGLPEEDSGQPQVGKAQPLKKDKIASYPGRMSGDYLILVVVAYHPADASDTARAQTTDLREMLKEDSKGFAVWSVKYPENIKQENKNASN